ncbi:MAG TPA: SPFH domain-containing protein [Candidatus Sulfotelmatobacter sp.]|nr:SPFH domain-containing protein [Candidatus Sulfotelmatobacter sp.]
MLSFMKVPPTTYLLQYKRGKVKREGAGLSFFYYAPTSTIVAIPMASTDVPFVFQEATADFQAVTIQGQFTYRVADPKRLASLLDFSIEKGRGFKFTDSRKAGEPSLVIAERLVHTLQTLTRTVTQRLALRDVLVSSDSTVAEVLAKFRASEAVSVLGVEILALSLLAIKPTPETSRALEAEAREALQRRADEAIYARRNAAVEQERLIKESELNTEIAIEEKKRQIRETQMAAEIAVERQRSELIERRVENERKDADSRAYALTETLKPLRDLDWKTLMMLNGKGADPKAMIALAFQEMAENAQKIGELNVSPDLLRSLIGTAGK